MLDRATASLPAVIDEWFASKGWQPRRHQLEMLEAARAERNALLVAPTGAGKTLAGFLPSLVELVEAPSDGLHTLYVSPLKALAVDVRRNLLTPIEEMNLPIRVETRTGDTPYERKVRQRVRPPQMLLTTPESLSLLLSHEDSSILFAELRTVVVDEIHAFASGKRGDLLSLAMARLQRFAPRLRRVGLSATVADPLAYQAWLAPGADAQSVALVIGDPGAKAEISILLPEDEKIPWSGHSGRWAAVQVMKEIERHKTSLIFCNTRSLAELIFQDLWAVNEQHLPIGIHHGSLALEARRKVENAVADGRLRGLVCTASLDLGVDWGDVDLVIQMGAPKGSSRLLQRIGRANHRLDEPSEAILVPGNRFEYLEARAALDAIETGELDPDIFRPGALDVLAQHIMAVACAGPFREEEMLAEVRSAAPYRDLDEATFRLVLGFIENGGYALRAYDRFKRLTRSADGAWRVSHPRFIQQHRMNAGIIVDAPLLDVRFPRRAQAWHRGGCLRLDAEPRRHFLLRRAGAGGRADRRHRFDRPRHIQVGPHPHLSRSAHGDDDESGRARRHFLHDRSQWPRFPDDVREWLEVQDYRSVLPRPEQLLVETFPFEHRHYMVAYSFEGWNAHQSLGMLLTRRMESAGLGPLGFVSNDYALACYSIHPVTDPKTLFSPDILEQEFVEWVQGSNLLRRAFREVAVIGGLVERHHPGKRKSGKQVTFSTDLIYDVLRRYEPDHLLLRAPGRMPRRG
jgi:ATP-dependent Lhr-like helicase